MTTTKERPARESTAGLLTTGEAAALLKVSPEAFRIMLRDGEIPTDVVVPLGDRRRRYSLVRLEAHLVQRVAAANVPANGDAADAAKAARTVLTPEQIKHRAAMILDGYPRPEARVEFVGGMSIGPGGVLRWGN